MNARAQAPQKLPVALPETKIASVGTLQRKCACGGSSSSAGGCPECQKKKLAFERPALSGPEPATVPPIVHDVLRSAGQPLNSATRAFFEPRFGHDFSRVRVHADVRAAQSAVAINARAYALGSQVVFGPGEYSPSTDRGRRSLAHELAHVVQQSTSSRASPSNLRIGPACDAAEQEADRFAEAVIRSEPRPPSTGPFPAALRRLVVVNPTGEASNILSQFNTLCSNSFSLQGSNITQHCDPGNMAKSRGCECLCDAAHDPNRTFTISARPATAGTGSQTLHDGTTVDAPTTSNFPETQVGKDTTVIVPASGSTTEFGSFAPDGHAEWAEDWRILEHELCGHARTSAGAGPIGNRPAHNLTIDIENIIAREHGLPDRGHFNDKRQGESFINPVGDRSKVRFVLKDGVHFEAP